MTKKEEIDKKYREDNTASERYWNDNPDRREKVLRKTARDWETARDCGTIKQRLVAAFSIFEMAIERHPESWWQKRLKWDRNIIPEIKDKPKDLFSDL